MISVSVVSFNTKELLQRCLRNISTQKCSQKIKVWVLDNNSSDNSIQMVKEEFPKVHLIEQKTNLGFAKGQNVLLKQIESEYILILNPDTDMENDVLDKMVEFMRKNPECGIASCRILGFDNKLHSNGGDLPFGRALLNWLFNLETFGTERNFHRQEESYYQKEHEVGWVGGTFMFVKKDVFEKIGYFNEDYFMYFEDTEFCYRARKNGFKIMINPEIEIQHASGASSKDPRLRQWSGEFRGLILFYQKNFGYFSGLCLRLLVYLVVVLRLVAFTLLGKLNFSKTYAKILFNI